MQTVWLAVLLTLAAFLEVGGMRLYGPVCIRPGWVGLASSQLGVLYF